MNKATPKMDLVYTILQAEHGDKWFEKDIRLPEYAKKFLKENEMNLNKVKLAEIAKTILKEYVDVDLSKIKYKVDGKKIYVSERDVRFATEYDVFSPKTNSTIKFKFSHSTGPEFDPKTQWVYKGPNGLEFIVTNDPVITKQLAANYLKAKLGK